MILTQADPERLEHNLRELEDLNVAYNIIGGKIQTEERVAGNRLYDAVKLEVTRLGKRFADAFRDLHTAHLDFDNFVDRLEDAGGIVSAIQELSGRVKSLEDTTRQTNNKRRVPGTKAA